MNFSHKIFLITCLLSSGNLSFALGENMWQTRDQQGAKLLSQGRAKQAETTFKNNHWQGVSQFKSAQYKKAVNTFNSLPKTANSFYNLGNALAHTKQYEKAIEAYKQSLKLNPSDLDAAHNKKLLEDLIKKQNKKDENKKDQNKKDQDKKDQDKKDQDKQPQNMSSQNKKREKDEAQKQQLKRVPDNPGGLLKQKFMRDYIKRHPQQRWY